MVASFCLGLNKDLHILIKCYCRWHKATLKRVKKHSAVWETGCHQEWLGVKALRESRMQWPLMRPLFFLSFNC